MHFTRWWNPSLPQTLLYGVMLLYVNAVFSLTSLMGLGIGGSAYELTPVLYTGTFSSLDQITTVQTIAVLAGALAYAFAGLGIAVGAWLKDYRAVQPLILVTLAGGSRLPRAMRCLPLLKASVCLLSITCDKKFLLRRCTTPAEFYVTGRVT